MLVLVLDRYFVGKLTFTISTRVSIFKPDPILRTYLQYTNFILLFLYLQHTQAKHSLEILQKKLKNLSIAWTKGMRIF